MQAGRTALYLATQRGQTSIVEMLVDKFHANVSSRSNDGSTLMHVAAMCGNADTAMWRVAPHVAWRGLVCMSTTPRPPWRCSRRAYQSTCPTRCFASPQFILIFVLITGSPLVNKPEATGMVTIARWPLKITSTFDGRRFCIRKFSILRYSRRHVIGDLRRPASA